MKRAVRARQSFCGQVNGYALHAADAFRRYQPFFCRNFDRSGAAIPAFLAINAFPPVPGNLKQACQGEQTEYGKI